MPASTQSSYPVVAIIGGGPAGLMAAEVLAENGVCVEVYDAMPSVGRKFLMAGKGGMNITHAEPFEDFLARYGSRHDRIEPLLRGFPPEVLRAWIHGLGIETFVGTSGRVFPTDMKAAPLLRAWLHRLRENGVHFHVRHRWLGFGENGALRFATPEGERTMIASATVLALGGGSWPQLGSDGAWVSLLAQCGIDIAPLRPANCGFDVRWSDHFREHFAGEPLKSIAATLGTVRKQGECVITEHGIEGGVVYAFSAALRDEIERNGSATLYLDLLPDWTAQRVQKEVSHPRGSRSLSTHLQSRLGLKGAKANLLREVLNTEQMHDSTVLAHAIKSLPLRLLAARPLSEAISSAGGITFEALNDDLMLQDLPGMFCAGEMLDWEAPTGGYLLTACLASGRTAGAGALNWLQHTRDLHDS
ncbi:TIGR03862 family flavoprotein [Sideroxydans lithotrophicus]|uniref:HI0933 family protein n=1 Tax=Sideroxydans lithotrophicus (strain ES-1) TaxID=580332 RepID=D5CLM7_SIDLE|nr:TIGR03862 family flavoprotein [Sideroxydans lithotrophicus]ADE12472.1 HI0933 family protein [Sideroxydans lithotrophicus ES-1]